MNEGTTGNEENGQSFYDEVCLSPSPENPRRLVWIASRNAGKAPDDVVTLRADFDRAARVVSVLFDKEQSVRAEIFASLHIGADRGLCTPRYSIEDGQANLGNLKDLITDHAHEVRDRMFREYTKLMVIWGIVPFLLGVLIFYTDAFGLFSRLEGGTKDLSDLYFWLLASLWLPTGAAVCVWAEFALRMQSGLSYDQLLHLDPSRWRPGQRLMITIGVSFILAFILAFDVVQIGIGGLLLNSFAAGKPILALAIGGITGLAFVAVRDIIFQLRPVERTKPSP
jgi:hypothetical protein